MHRNEGASAAERAGVFLRKKERDDSHMKKALRRLGALVLVLTMLMGLGLTASAAVTNPTITFQGVEAGDVVTAYRLVKYTNTNYNSYTFDSDFNTFVSDKHTGSGKTNEQWLSEQNNAQIGALLDEYAKLLLTTGNGIDLPTDLVTGTATGTSVDLELEPGYYIVLTATTVANSKIYTPVAVFVQVQSGNVKVYGGPAGTEITSTKTVDMKSVEAPTQEKKVWNGTTWEAANTAAVGEEVDFRVQVDIPNYTVPVTDLTLTLTDTLTNLMYKDGSVAVYSDADCTTPIAGGVTVDGTTTVYSGGTQTLVLNLDYDKIKSALGATQVYVKYTAEVQHEATAAGTGIATVDASNSVVLTYHNAADPSGAKTTTAKRTDTYDFAVHLAKKAADGTTVLPGAGFTLYKEDKTTPIQFYEIIDGDYRPATSLELLYPAILVTEMTVDPTNAELTIRGLKDGTYYLKETTVPSGYYAPNNMFKIVLKPNSTDISKLDTTETKFTAENAADTVLIKSQSAGATNSDQLDIVLKNSDVPVLPSTGGMGTVLFTVGGVVLMVAAAWMILARRRKNAK